MALHDSLEPDVRSAAASGLSLTQWRARRRLARNQEMKQEVAIEWTRVVTRSITSPVQQQRRLLLESHLDKVRKGSSPLSTLWDINGKAMGNVE